MSNIQITTSQNVSVNFSLGSVGHRVLAYLIDFFIKCAYMFIVGLSIDRYVQGSNEEMWIFFLFCPVYLYTLLSEILMDGQTIGKKIMGIKVVKLEGYAAGVKEFFLRWVLNDIWLFLSLSLVAYSFSGSWEVWFSMFPLIFIVDFMVMVLNKKNQRIGDILAGTIVITIRNHTHINQTILENLSEEYQPVYPQVVKLSDGDARIIKESFKTARNLNDKETLKRLRKRIEDVIDVQDNEKTDIQFISTVMKDFNYYTQDMV
ncbi:MAG: RDD family protein [Flavobacteriales bacterium]